MCSKKSENQTYACCALLELGEYAFLARSLIDFPEYLFVKSALFERMIRFCLLLHFAQLPGSGVVLQGSDFLFWCCQTTENDAVSSIHIIFFGSIQHPAGIVSWHEKQTVIDSENNI